MTQGSDGFGQTQASKSRSKLYLRLLMRLTEKFGATEKTGPIIKKSLDRHLEKYPIIDNSVSNFIFNIILFI